MKINPIVLDAVQKRKWIETRSAILWRCPAFTHILFSMLNPSRGELAATFTMDVPIAATDGSSLILNPVAFFAMPLDERVFVVAHEIMHCILNHCIMARSMRLTGKVKYTDGTHLPFNHQIMNYAMDLVINDMLINDKIGKFPTIGVHDPKIATMADSFVDAYRKVWEDLEKKGGKGSAGQGNVPGGFDVILDPGSASGQDPATAAQGRSQTAWDTAVAAALSAAKMQGKLPANLQRLLQEIVEPTVTWQDHIRGFFARKVGAGGYDWRKPDRRLIVRDIYAPQRSGSGTGTIVVAIDTSGSIGQRELDQFFGEMRGILDDVRPNQMFLLWIDAKLHKVDELADSSDLAGLKPHGGGGTDFRPAFDWVEAEGVTPECLVYLTDGMGTFPDRAPSYPTLWGNIYPHAKYPWGDVVQVDIKRK